MAPRHTISNQRAYERYRGIVEADLRHDPLSIVAGGDIGFVTIVVSAWSSRYSRRRDVIGGIPGWGDPLADTVAQAALVARHRARNAAATALPELEPFTLELVQMSLAHLHQAGRLDAASLEDLHGYGPSLRRLWAEAAALGLSGRDAWLHIADWARHRPAGWGPPGQPKRRRRTREATQLDGFLAQPLDWRLTGDLEVPWATTAAGRRWQLRLNDFPDEPMYTLLIDGQPAGDFHDWPDAWRSEDRVPAEPPPAVAVPAGPAQPQIAPGTLLRRYQAGEHEQVWADMVALGPGVREEPYLGDAQAVARETMRRVRHNLELIVARLEELGYRFWDDSELTAQKRQMMGNLLGGLEALGVSAPGARRLLEELDRWRAAAPAPPPRRPLRPPERGARRALSRLERRGCVLPLSLRAWIEVVGEVDLNGSHPALGVMEGEPGFRGVYPDPLMVVIDADWVEEQFEAWRESDEAEDEERCELEIGFGDGGKAGLAMDAQVDDLYTIAIPEPAADALLQGERHQTTFVNYLRLACRWGGFPGWDGQPDPPTRELAFLTEGLLSF